MQISRLFQVIYILLEKGTVTANELAERFEVSVRTIYRDVEALSQAGIPIYTSQGKGGGISLSDRFILNKSLLSDTEQDKILFALQSLSAAQHPGYDDVLAKLSSLFMKNNASWIEVDFSSWGNERKQTEIFGLLKKAILGRKVISFTYYSASGEKRDRSAAPVKLLFKNRAWYFQGYCLEHMAIRTFKITRMSDVRLAGEQDGERPPMPDKMETVEHKVTLRLKFDAAAAYRVLDDFSEEEVSRFENGSFLVTTNMPAGEWLYDYLLSFGPLVEVAEPECIRSELIVRIKKMAEKYF
ncbi:transcriptional regulator [Paenibacillus yonginensis]|uniref:Transcriptional regulator n=1 Tax=Paenibacillus yonginensis TaxID=1462996 RepID=A0A1B1MZY6_9BACL|nr:YafY family protein [Paenibacillus yonginensis]ANS74728.1 transcriptional regulator [Paenibacillus yonginensis]